MIRTYRYNRFTGTMEEVRRSDEPLTAPAVFGDIPDYESPIDGRVVHGRRGRREDLKRSRCRPYEGRQQEEREAARQRAYNEQKSDARLHDVASRAYYSLPPSKRRILESQ